MLRIMLLLVLVLPGPAKAMDVEDWSRLEPAFDHLCRDVLAGADIDPDAVRDLLEHVSLQPQASVVIPRYDGAPGAYQAFSLDRPMRQLLRYLYNPSIPEEVLKPFSIRSSQWLEPVPQLENLWLESWPPDRILVLRGIQEDRTTPDGSTGGWYRMRLQRALILMPWENGQALLSVSVQPESSEVGAKGYALGVENGWPYVYSDQEGLTKTGLGWVKSRIESNVSVAVFLARPGQPVVKGVFQWLRAGWSGLSVVTAEHVRQSLLRYEQELGRVLHASDLPEPEALEQRYRELAALDSAAVRQIWVWPDVSAPLPPSLAQALDDESYLEALDDREVRSMVLTQWLRHSLSMQ